MRLYTLLHNEKKYLIAATATYFAFCIIDLILSYSSPQFWAESKLARIALALGFVVFGTLWFVFYIYNRDL